MSLANDCSEVTTRERGFEEECRRTNDASKLYRAGWLQRLRTVSRCRFKTRTGRSVAEGAVQTLKLDHETVAPDCPPRNDLERCASRCPINASLVTTSERCQSGDLIAAYHRQGRNILEPCTDACDSWQATTTSHSI